ncbi:MAG: dihydrofolate reductase [Pseudomonadota bacterium]
MDCNGSAEQPTSACVDTPPLSIGALSMIVAVADNGVIGKGNELPWRLSADLRYFKQRTLGKPIIMGRKTWESIGRPLPGRENVVVTRDSEYRADGATLFHSLDDAIAAYAKEPEIMVIGGASIYELALPLISRLYLTRVHINVDRGDAFFEVPDLAEWQQRCHRYLSGEQGQPDCTFEVYDRKLS